MNEQRNKRYLGDSVYISHDGYHVILTTQNGYGATNTIFLEPHLKVGLNNYVEMLKEHLKEEKNNEDSP